MVFVFHFYVILWRFCTSIGQILITFIFQYLEFPLIFLEQKPILLNKYFLAFALVVVVICDRLSLTRATHRVMCMKSSWDKDTSPEAKPLKIIVPPASEFVHYKCLYREQTDAMTPFPIYDQMLTCPVLRSHYESKQIYFYMWKI